MVGTESVDVTVARLREDAERRAVLAASAGTLEAGLGAPGETFDRTGGSPGQSEAAADTVEPGRPPKRRLRTVLALGAAGGILASAALNWDQVEEGVATAWASSVPSSSFYENYEEEQPVEDADTAEKQKEPSATATATPTPEAAPVTTEAPAPATTAPTETAPPAAPITSPPEAEPLAPEPEVAAAPAPEAPLVQEAPEAKTKTPVPKEQIKAARLLWLQYADNEPGY